MKLGIRSRCSSLHWLQGRDFFLTTLRFQKQLPLSSGSPLDLFVALKYHWAAILARVHTEKKGWDAGASVEWVFIYNLFFSSWMQSVEGRAKGSCSQFIFHSDKSISSTVLSFLLKWRGITLSVSSYEQDHKRKRGWGFAWELGTSHVLIVYVQLQFPCSIFPSLFLARPRTVAVWRTCTNCTWFMAEICPPPSPNVLFWIAISSVALHTTCSLSCGWVKTENLQRYSPHLPLKHSSASVPGSQLSPSKTLSGPDFPSLTSLKSLGKPVLRVCPCFTHHSSVLPVWKILPLAGWESYKGQKKQYIHKHDEIVSVGCFVPSTVSLTLHNVAVLSMLSHCLCRKK